MLGSSRSGEFYSNATKALAIAVRELAMCDVCGRGPDRTQILHSPDHAGLLVYASCAHGAARPGTHEWYGAVKRSSAFLADDIVVEPRLWRGCLTFFRRGFSVYPRDRKPRKTRPMALFRQRRQRVLLRRAK